MTSNKKPWWHNSVRFTCTQCGNCCRTNGEYAYVYLTSTEITQAAKYLNIKIREFRKKYITKEQGYEFVKDPQSDCHFLTVDGKCSIHPVKPRQCRDWPFWKENLASEKIWREEVAVISPGVAKGMSAGDGKFYSHEEIEGIMNNPVEGP